MHRVERLWPGETVVCMATGPSLNQSDVDFVRGRAMVVCVNDAHRLAPWADVLYSSDQRWWEFYRGVPEFAGLKFGIQPLAPRRAWQVTVLRNTGSEGIETQPDGLRTGKNSGAAAINLAVHLGARRIVLLGYDMGCTPGQPAHFFGAHPEQLRTNVPPTSFVPFFGAMVEPLDEIGVTVVNCSRTTALKCFPRMDVSEALALEVAA